MVTTRTRNTSSSPTDELLETSQLPLPFPSSTRTFKRQPTSYWTSLERFRLESVLETTEADYALLEKILAWQSSEYQMWALQSVRHNQGYVTVNPGDSGGGVTKSRNV